MSNNKNPRNYYKSLWDEYQHILMLSSFPVAVKMLQDVRMIDDITDEKGRPIRRIDQKLTICQFLGQARYWDIARAGTSDMLSTCVSGGAYMGFWGLPENYADGYVRGYFPTEELARKTVATCPHFEPGEYAGMIVSSLQRAPVDPDVVIFFPNVAQTLVLISAYIYNKGGKIDAEFTMVGGCSQPIVPVMKTGKPNIFIPTNGARILAWPSDTELTFSIPGGSLEDLLEGLKFIYQGRAIRYPTVWQHINWLPQGVIRNVMDGKGLYPPEQRHPKNNG